jgi:hypothetical protein
MKITVLYVKETGQVMAAVTRVALVEAAAADDEEVSPDVRALAGADLPVRGFIDANGSTVKPDPATFSIQSEDLAALTVDGEDHQLLAPRHYVVLDGKKIEPTQPGTLPGVTAMNGGSTLQVSLAAPTLEDLPLVVHVLPQGSASGRQQRLQATFKPDTPSKQIVDLNVGPALSGDYVVLVLARGYAPGLRQVHA